MFPPPEPPPRATARTRRFRRIARLGFATNGLIHLIVGVIAISLAFGISSDGQANTAGALTRIASSPGGLVVVWVAVATLLALGAWQLIRATRVDEAGVLKRWGLRTSEASKGLVYLALGGTALLTALGNRRSSSVTTLAVTAELLKSTLGVLVLAAIGLGVFIGGVSFITIGIRRGFRKQIRIPTGWGGRVILILGLAGYIAEGLALISVGIVFVAAAITSDGREASGLDGAFTALIDVPFGTVLLALIGFGLLLYAVFLVARAKLAHL